MNTVRSIKLIKNTERKDRGVQIAVELAIDKRRSTGVRAWVVQSQLRDRSEHLPAFDSLFTDALRPSGRGAKSGSS